MSTSQENKAIISLHKPDLGEKLFFFISGIISSIPLTLFIDQLTNSILVGLPSVYALVLSSIIFAPFVEEFAKVFPLFYRHGETQKSIITLGFLVGLGFGIVEFLTYLLVLGSPIPARLPALFLHPTITTIAAYGIATKRTVWFYLVAVALHLSFNLSILFYPFLPNFGAIAVLMLAFFMSWHFYNKTKETFVT